MITDIQIYINGEVEETRLRELISDVCDVLSKYDLANSGDSTVPLASVVISSQHEFVGDAVDFISAAIDTASLIVLPVKSKGEFNDASS